MRGREGRREIETNSLCLQVKYAVFSSNLVADYSFMAPIAAICWRARTEFAPVCLLTETREHWDVPSGRVVLDMLERIGCRKHYIGPITEPYRTSVQAQAARQHAAALYSFAPDDYLMCADVDMLPIHGAWFSHVDWDGKAIHLRHASAWGYRWHTTPYIGASVAVWREFMGYEAAGEIYPILQANLDRDLTPDRDTLTEWYWDEFFYTSRLRASRFWPSQCEFIERTIYEDRIDRGYWPADLDGIEQNRYVDSHVLRPAHADASWPRIKELLTRLLSANQMEEICKYRDRFMSAIS